MELKFSTSAKITRITVGHDLYGKECLHVWPDEETAERMIDDSPVSDGVTMSSTTYHRAATQSDILRLRYDSDGNDLLLS